MSMNASVEPNLRELAAAEVVCGHCFRPNRVPRSRLGDEPKCGSCGKELLDGEPVALGDKNFDAFVAKSELPVVVDFWAAWCAPCRMMAPVLDAVARELKASIRFAKVDVDAAQMLAQRFRVVSIPTLVLFREGTEAQRTAGAMPPAQLKRWIAAAS
jgi:thioredoxin 2